MKGTKIIKREIQTKEICEEEDAKKTYTASVIQSLINLLGTDSSITYSCCSWSCCNYNSTTLAMASAPTAALNITAEGLYIPGSTGVSISCTFQLIIHLLITIFLFFY